MPRIMSFAITTRQMYAGSKDITRRLGWANLKPGEILWAVEKGQGLQRGEKVKKIGQIQILSTRWEPLWKITRAEVIREGFPEMSVRQFVEMFCATHKCTMYQNVNRIEFKRLYNPLPYGKG